MGKECRMRKVLIVAFLVCLFTTFAFAAESFTVQTVTGPVKNASGVEIKANDKLDGDTVISVGGLGAYIILNDSTGKDMTLRQSGKVSDLIAKASGGLRMSQGVVQTDTTAVTRSIGQTSTASARASDQAGEDDIAAE